MARVAAFRALPWRSQLVLGLLLGFMGVAGVLPSSFGWCMGNKARWTAAVAGMFGNAIPGMLLALALALALSHRKRALAAALSVGFALTNVVTIGCVEFALERGTPVALFDVANGLDASFILSQFPLLWGGRFGPFVALATAVFAACLFVLLQRLSAAPPSSGQARAERVTLPLIVVLLCAALFIVHRTARGEFASRPYARLLGAVMTTNAHNIVVGVEPVLLERAASEGEAARGFPLLGMHAEPCTGGLRIFEPLPNEAPKLPDFEAKWAELAARLGELGRPLSLTFMLLESVGAEDIHALDSGAPRGLTPYLDKLASAEPHTLAMRHLLQAGQRTAFAMSGLLCGVGTAPALLAPLRDLPHLKLRCWPDLAAEAGTKLGFFYGEDLAFDRYRGTLEEHGFSYLPVAKLEGRKRGGWGLSDRELFVDVLASISAEPAGAAAPLVRGMLTLSTHSPYGVPEDMPAAQHERARALARGVTESGEAQAHWVTVSYLDDALSRFIPDLIAAELERGRTPVVLMVGDHTSGQTLGRHPLASSRIPAFWVLPPTLEAALIAPVQAALEAHIWSQNDLARMALYLLDGAGALRTLPEASRWHSMGGQTLSPAFAAPAPFQAARLWSVDVRAQSRLLDSAERVLVQQAFEAPSRRDDLEHMGFAGAAIPSLSWLLQHPDRLGPCPAP